MEVHFSPDVETRLQQVAVANGKDAEQLVKETVARRLTKDEPRVDDELRAFLPRAYSFKRIADYETGPGSHISTETARNAIATARFVDCVTALIPPNGHTPHASDTPKPT